MRKHKIDVVIESDTNLVVASSARVTITAMGGGEYRITSNMRFYATERSGFIGRHLVRRLGKYKYIKGNCSAPTAYLWH